MKTLLSAFLETPWALLPAKLAVLADIVQRHDAGLKLTAEEVQARIGSRTQSGPALSGAVAVLPLFGTIFPRANLMTDTSGATSAERFAATLRQAADDPVIGAIVLDVDSPGGSVAGITEAAAVVREATTQKPVVAIANGLAASAAYWIASAATELMVTPSGEVGSIGVFAAHEDMSAALEQAGVKVSLISAGKFKTEGSPYVPLTDEARAAIQDSVNRYYDMFVRDVARGRNTTPDAVRAGFGEGRTVGARAAVAQGMADAVGTLDDAIQRARQLARRANPAPAAELDFRQRRARAAGQE